MLEERIKLAELMGWQYVEAYGTQSGPIYGKLPAGGGLWEFPGNSSTRKHTRREPPDPFTNASDDYEVLKWRRSDAVKSWLFSRKLMEILKENASFYSFVRPILSYRVGDYARAALKEIDQ